MLEMVLPGTKLDYRPDQSHGEYDFDLRHPDGTIAAVEVTSSTDEKAKQAYSAIGDRKKGGPDIKAVKCAKSWIVFPTPNARINQIRQGVDSYLSRLESSDITSFRCIDGGRAEVEEICRDLRLLGGSVIDKRLPRIRIAYPPGGGVVSRRTAIEAGAKEAWKEDNRRKLDLAGTNERHLFVYIEGPSLAWVSITQFEPPRVIPDLPREITNIWVVGEDSRNEFLIWSAETNKPWSCGRLIARVDADGNPGAIMGMPPTA